MAILKKKISKWIAVSLIALILICISLPRIDQAFGASYGIKQSRRIAEIYEFPKSYQNGLNAVKQIYPNAQFILYDTGLDWNKDLLSTENELMYRRNLIRSYHPTSWKSPDAYNWETGTYNEVEPGWVQASNELIEYCMDPRNFFDENGIFQFLNLGYDGTQTLEGVEKIIVGTFMENNTVTDENGNVVSYAQLLLQLGQQTGVSPYLLAARLRQEQGVGKSQMISGKYPGYEGYYNFFNIAASGPTKGAILANGLSCAKSNGWNTPYRSLRGGTMILANNFVGVGKDCMYLQHFTVAADENGVVTYIPYMTNILAPQTETSMMKQAYTDYSLNYTFIIPVYQNMPEQPCPIPQGNQSLSEQYILKSLTINDGEIPIPSFSSTTYNYVVSSDQELSEIKIKAELYSSSQSIKINGKEIDMDGGRTAEYAVPINTGFNDIFITATSPSGVPRSYQITVQNNDGKPHYKGMKNNIGENTASAWGGQTVAELKQDISTLNCFILITDADGKVKSGSDICSSGDILIIMDNKKNVIYMAPIVVKGDLDDDGYITNDDVHSVIAHIIESDTLDAYSQQMADMDNDGKITARDIGKMKVKTDSKFELSATDISVKIHTEEDRAFSNITLDIPSGSHYVVGYLKYDENKVLMLNTENSGRIQFVADGNSVVFSGETDHLECISLTNSQTQTFAIIVSEIYDYALDKTISPSTHSEDINIKTVAKDLNMDIPVCTELDGHQYIYSTNKEATADESKKQMGICQYCGKTNVRTIYGTRKEYINEVHINIQPATTGQDGFPQVLSETSRVHVSSTIWENTSGIRIEGNTEDVVLKHGETYTMANLVLLTDKAHCFYDRTKIYINGVLYGGELEAYGAAAIIRNAGQFNFDK